MLPISAVFKRVRRLPQFVNAGSGHILGQGTGIYAGNGNNKITTSGTPGNVSSNTGIVIAANAKGYFEGQLNSTSTTGDWALGINTTPNTGAYPGTSGSGWCIANNQTAALLGTHNNVSTPMGLAATVPGSIFMIAYDLTAGKIWLGSDGVWAASGNPAAGTNPFYTGLTNTTYAIEAGSYFSTDAITLAASYNQFTYAPPSGFFAPF